MQQKRDAAKKVALAKLTQIIKDAKCDVIVVVSNIHRVEKNGHHPIFGIMRAEKFPVAKMSERLFDPEARKHKLDEEKDKYHVRHVDGERPGHPALATWLVNGLIEDGFDIATHDSFAPEATLDDAFAFVDKWLFDNVPIPIVPFVISRAGAPTTYRAATEALGSTSLFVKPANMGSSVGVSPARSETEFAAACESAFRYDTKVVIELAVISLIRHRYMDTPLLSAAFQVMVGGALVFLAGILIGSS